MIVRDQLCHMDLCNKRLQVVPSKALCEIKYVFVSVYRQCAVYGRFTKILDVYYFSTLIHSSGERGARKL